eukprot:TRINITY_DN718_c0_g1_i2.p1 TRINITY_DN718_c0_g1~~TRINITY_DN718_c0_g1_i2.p1  ORF type:complete len:279 (-),score=65.86 TRINITY_DN718_c0_g1_i2:1217-2053(-)
MAADAAAAKAAAAAAVSLLPSPAEASLASPFVGPVTPRGRGKGPSRAKRPASKSPAAKSAAPLTKKKNAAAAASAAAGSSGTKSSGVAAAPEPTPAAMAAWKLVRGRVKRVVVRHVKALWVAVKKSTAQIEHVRTNDARLKVQVDAQGQGHARTVMVVASMRVAAETGLHQGATPAGFGQGSGSGSSSGTARNKDVKPVVKREDVQVAAMAIAPDNEANAAQLRRPVRAAVKNTLVTATQSRDIRMNADAQTAVVTEQVCAAFDLQAEAAHSYLMNTV